MSLTVGSLFSGIGGLDLGLERAGMTVRWQSEIDPYASRVLAKHWPDVPNHGDITTIDWSTIEPVDLICGGFPCQDISPGGKRVGISGERSGLWSEFVRALRCVRPRYAIVENSGDLTVRGLDVVLGDLCELGFDAEWSVVSACSMGAPHRRRRLFVVAYCPGVDEPNEVPHHPLSDRQHPDWQGQPRGGCGDEGRQQRWLSEPALDRVAHGVPARVVGPQLRALGNAVVPQVAEFVGRQLLDHLAV